MFNVLPEPTEKVPLPDTPTHVAMVETAEPPTVIVRPGSSVMFGQPEPLIPLEVIVPPLSVGAAAHSLGSAGSLSVAPALTVIG